MSDEQSRRQALRIAALAAIGVLTPTRILHAASLVTTPSTTLGPFYPRELPLEDDNDLTRVKGASGVAKGVILDLTGRVLDASGRPLANTQVEIWQCNAFGRYHHPDDHSNAPLDPSFQGFGKTITDGDGRYRFRTIRPVPYPGRTPHIHFKLASRSFGTFVTQMFVAGEPGNDRDYLFRRMQEDRKHKASVVALKSSDPSGAALSGEFEIVLAAM
ncbi:MAG TPA: protocatechuate 3,4-dioxygenase [Burkholderiales bacterium]|nr:protocatechuate 3,4-dioxygenase [Burkholderiales bacterium]